MKTLRLSSDLTLPIDAVTQAIGILAKRRAGKSYLARRLAEQLFKAGQQIVIVDPKGDWWGIRSSADGKSPGLPVVILGGERGDVPLEVNAGEIVAKLVTEERVSVLLDLSLFRKHEVTTFMTAFLENLYRLKAKEIYRTPLMLFIDEADAIAPQKPQETQARMLGAAEDIVRRGGQRGIGCTLITQRSAVLNKNVLTQVEMMVALRTIAPQDLKAMDAWIEVHGEKEQRDTLMTSLPALPEGDAWFWSPGWPTRDGLFQRTHVAKIETFDSGATPKSGEKRVEPKNLADVDLDSLTRQMAATIEKAKADDPKELKKRLAERDRRIRQLEAVKPGERVVTKAVVDQAAIDRAVNTAVIAERKRITRELRSVHVSLMKYAGPLASLTDSIGNLARALNEIEHWDVPKTAAVIPIDGEPLTRIVRPVPVPRAPRPDAPLRAAYGSNGSRSGEVSRGEQRILDALAELKAFGIDPATRSQAGVMAGYTLSGGTGAQHVGRLVESGLVVIRSAGMLELTDGGDRIASSPSGALSLAELHNRALAKLSAGERRILEHLISVYPDGQSRADVGAAVNYTLSGGTGAQHVGKLVTLGFAEIPRTGYLSAGEVLFPEGLS